MDLDPYAVLDIPRGSSPAEVRAAYRRAAKRAHPDAPHGNAERFRQVQIAYDLLSDQAARADLDREESDGRGERAVTEPPLHYQFSFSIGLGLGRRRRSTS